MKLSLGADWIANKFGQAVQRLREKLGLSRAELGQPVGLSEQAIAEVEAGTRKLTSAKIEDLMKVLGCQPKALGVGTLELMEEVINWEENFTEDLVPATKTPSSAETSVSNGRFLFCPRNYLNPRRSIECRGCQYAVTTCSFINDREA